MSDIVTIRGFAATRPELRALPSGVPVASFRVQVHPAGSTRLLGHGSRGVQTGTR